jgi:hypothetical protein
VIDYSVWLDGDLLGIVDKYWTIVKEIRLKLKTHLIKFKFGFCVQKEDEMIW